VRSESSFGWPTLVLSVAAIFLLLHGSATALGSLRGEAGIAVSILVVAACLIAQRVLRGMSMPVAAHAIGLGRPAARSLGVAAAGATRSGVQRCSAPVHLRRRTCCSLRR
jgi:hypothetical protein